MKKLFAIAMVICLVFAMSGAVLTASAEEAKPVDVKPVSFLYFTCPRGNATVEVKMEEHIDLSARIGTDEWTPVLEDRTFTLGLGERVYFKGTNPNGLGGNLHFAVSGVATVGGDLTTLLSENGQVDTIPCENCFAGLFAGSAGLTGASELELPSMNLAKGCYAGMFKDCTMLENAPLLPAEELAENCYENLFCGCKSLHAVTVRLKDYKEYEWSADEILSTTTAGWLEGVADRFFFCCTKDTPTNLRGVDFIPEQAEIVIGADKPYVENVDYLGASVLSTGNIVILCIVGAAAIAAIAALVVWKKRLAGRK